MLLISIFNMEMTAPNDFEASRGRDRHADRRARRPRPVMFPSSGNLDMLRLKATVAATRASTGALWKLRLFLATFAKETAFASILEPFTFPLAGEPSRRARFDGFASFASQWNELLSGSRMCARDTKAPGEIRNKCC